MRTITVLGARPQFVKAAVVSCQLKSAGIDEVIVHTGQHFDPEMSDAFFSELGLPDPKYNLGIHGMKHGAMTGRMMEAIESLLVDLKPDLLLVYGDTNSTLAGALAASKLGVPIAHVEAGLRSNNRAMPEEVNRILTDRISQLLFAPTPGAVACLEREGIADGVYLVGDVMMDAVLSFQDLAGGRSQILQRHGLLPDQFYLATVHRPSNADDRDRLAAILAALVELPATVALPLHPRTRGRIMSSGFERYLDHPNLAILPPVGYLDMLMLEKGCRAVITDSGGVQKEAYISQRPCFTLRAETEWQETVETGWNRLVEPDGLVETVAAFTPPGAWPALYGEGQAAKKIVDVLASGWTENYERES